MAVCNIDIKLRVSACFFSEYREMICNFDGSSNCALIRSIDPYRLESSSYHRDTWIISEAKGVLRDHTLDKGKLLAAVGSSFAVLLIKCAPEFIFRASTMLIVGK